MKPIFTLAVSAALTLWSLSPASAAPKAKAMPSSAEAEEILASIDNSSSVVADAAFRLHDKSLRLQDPAGQLDELQTMKAEINSIGSELKTLEAERDALAPWEAKALDEVMPLLHDAAVNANQAIETYNSARSHLYASPYVADTEKVSEDAAKAASLLHEYVSLARVRNKESKLEENLGEAQQ